MIQVYARFTDGDIWVAGAERPPCGPGFDWQKLRQADVLEVWVERTGNGDSTTQWRLCKGSRILASTRWVGAFFPPIGGTPVDILPEPPEGGGSRWRERLTVVSWTIGIGIMLLVGLMLLFAM